ncbi:hypothetical protein CLPU_12c00100 [Gottschalkia purinilytica]|uniref:UPF0316 protein CLPU_12c00100 n=1 Tax=Gottschalkia purinilytica TaxID=1503 RepID=A0A0L0W8G3_GOTPU|nr:DUF5698 domain-containing protein [Gottschalkia purinilytica]KNF07737.1 hypothetical protein CLPU_12c00100 [Gottschalkia purinilytica]
MDFLIIFFAKIFEVSLTTIRTVFLARGEKLISSVIGFVEVLIWLKIVSVVLVGINESPQKMFAYALGFAFGNYVGLIVEEKIALGHYTIQAIVNKEAGDKLAKFLREQNIAVTEMTGKGKDNEKSILLIHVRRRNKQNIISLIEEHSTKAFITIIDAKQMFGGYGLTRKRR